MHPLALHMLAVKHQHMGLGMVHPNDGVKSRHGVPFKRSNGVSLLEGGLAGDAALGMGRSVQPHRRDVGAAVHAQSVDTRFDALQSSFDTEQLGGFMFVDGKRHVPTRLDLRVVVVAFVQSLAGGVCAADGATALSVYLRQQGIAFYNESVFVFLSGDGVHGISR